MASPLDNPADDGRMLVQHNMVPAFNVDEIISFHEEGQALWRQVYHAIGKWSDRFCWACSHHSSALPAFSLPTDIQLWNARFRKSMLEMKPVVVGLGLFYHMRGEEEEMGHIIRIVSSITSHVAVNVTSDTLAQSALLMRQQRLMGTQMLFTIAGLRGIIRFFRPLRIGFERRIERLRWLGMLPPALHALTNHAEADFTTLGGLLPPAISTPFHSPTPREWISIGAPPGVMPTSLDLSANTIDSDLDTESDSEVGDLEDDEDLSADDGSGTDETTDNEFFFAAADASVRHQ